ncbi:MAG: response regulator [Desulfobacteraceae bacterium]|nr:response regulator [Desulfobacteraceae bacterium]
MIKPLHILITDLNHNVQDFLTRELKKEGCIVYNAENTIEAQKYIYGSNRLDIVILDPELPDLFEQPLLDEVQDRLPPVPVIIHTYKEIFDDMIKDDNIYFVEKNARSIKLLKEKILEITTTC